MDYFSWTMAIINMMWIHDDKTEDITIIEKILRSLTPKLNFIVCSIEEAKDIDELFIGELQNSLIIHEQKLNQQDNEQQALWISSNIIFLPHKEVDKEEEGAPTTITIDFHQLEI